MRRKKPADSELSVSLEGLGIMRILFIFSHFVYVQRKVDYEA